MKILIDARTLGTKPSGIGIYTYNFIQGIRHYSDWDVVLTTDVIESAQMKQLVADGIRVIPFDATASKTAKVLSYFHFVRRTILEEKPDIFWEPNNLFPTKLKNPYGKIVVTVHDLFPFTMPECYTRVYPYYFRYGIRNMLKYADGIIYISKVTKHAMEQYFPGAKNKNHCICYNIIEQPEEAETRQGDYFLYIGNLERRKGTDILLRGYRKYVEAGGDRPLVLGGAIREADIEQLLEETKASCPKVEYLGYVTAEERQARYAGCYGLVFPSRAEGFGMPVIEALHYGKPVLVSDLPIFHETAGDALQYVSLPEDVEASAKALAHAMLEMQPQDEAVAHQVAGQYREELLTRNLMDFFEHLR